MRSELSLHAVDAENAIFFSDSHKPEAHIFTEYSNVESSKVTSCLVDACVVLRRACPAHCLIGRRKAIGRNPSIGENAIECSQRRKR